jgi:hypothetical protein
MVDQDNWEPEDDEPGLNLDNDSLIVTGDQGIPIKGFSGQRTHLSHEEQARMRQTFGCSHKNMKLEVEVVPTTPGTMKMLAGGRMIYSCEDCHITVIEGHITTFNYRMMKTPDDFNNPFITGQH